MRWLHKFLYSDDPDVKVAAGLSEPEAQMLQELLENSGIPSMIKNMKVLSVTYGCSLGNEFDMWVKRSDLSRAREVLEAVVRPEVLVYEEGERGG
jgi:hypothetical protein